MTAKPRKPLTVKEEQQIKALLATGKTCHAVAIEIGRDPKTIKKYAIQPETAKEIRELKEELSDMFEGIAKRMILSITDEDILKINSYQRTVSAGISVDKMRLLRNQSTENISVRESLNNINKLSEEIEELKRSIGGDEE